MSKKILVAVTGMSPQIVTETLFVLVVKQAWIPDEVHVLTTSTGQDRLCRALWDEGQHFVRFCQEYDVQGIHFSPQHIHLIEDNAGNALDDIRTPEQNNLAADKIIRFIHDLCMQDEVELHVSIAGGRKSMGFYIGYALSLFGRRQDRLSHVLVNEPYENNVNFFYPSKEDCWIDGREGKINARLAEVMLADIPFVRMRDGMPKMVLDKNGSYLQAVEQTQQHLADWFLEVDTFKEVIRCGKSNPIRFKPQHFALYCAMTELKIHDIPVRFSSAESMESLIAWFCKYYAGEANEDALRKDNFTMMRRILQEGSSAIYRELEKVLGDYADFFRISGKGKNKNKIYELATPRAQISLRK